LFSGTSKHVLRPILSVLFWLAFTLGVFAHGAWLGGGGIGLTPASKAAIRQNLTDGNAPIAVGDVIQVIADFPVITAGTLDGPGGYATLYVPDGTEVVGAYITDASGTPVPAKPARASTGSGVSKGWGPKGRPTRFFPADAHGSHDGLGQREIAYSLCSPISGQRIAGDSPDLLRVGPEEHLKELPAEAIGHPLREGCLWHAREKFAVEQAEHHGGASGEAHVLECIADAQRIVVELAFVMNSR